MGPVMPLAAAGRGLAVSHSPGVPAGAVTGGTWSKNPPFSSCTMNSTVCAHTDGLDTSVLSTVWIRCSPYPGGAAGCSHCASGGKIHDTAGSLPDWTSWLKSSG